MMAENVYIRFLAEGALHFPERQRLGERMYQAIREVLGRGYEACILMGTDVPEVRSEVSWERAVWPA